MIRKVNHNIPSLRADSRSAGRRGYTLVEALIAAVIVAIGIGAAALLAMTMISQQEVSAQVVRALNYQEQACRMYQLGVDPAIITNWLPRESAVESLTFSTNLQSISGVGNVEMAVCEMVISPGSRFGASSARTNTQAVLRPSIR
jgi:prepilin-type N-terminal cleavage/methylation domain-containing protein